MEVSGKLTWKKLNDLEIGNFYAVTWAGVKNHQKNEWLVFRASNTNISLGPVHCINLNNEYNFSEILSHQSSLRNLKIRLATPSEILDLCLKIPDSPQLPKINGYDGELLIEDGLIRYGCAKLAMSWFNGTSNRRIASMTLSSGVDINMVQVDQIRGVLESHGLITDED